MPVRKKVRKFLEFEKMEYRNATSLVKQIGFLFRQKTQQEVVRVQRVPKII